MVGVPHAETAPEAVLKALQGPVQEALQHAQDEDRTRTSAAAEALSGLVACSKVFDNTSGKFQTAHAEGSDAYV